MKKLSILILLFSCITLSSIAQNTSEIKRGPGSTCIQDNKTLTTNELQHILSDYPEARKEYNKYKSNTIVSMIFGGVGGALVGYPVGTWIGGGEPNWALAGIGAGVICVSIPFSIQANKRLNKALEIYNDSLNSDNDVSFYFGPTQNGIGLCLKF